MRLLPAAITLPLLIASSMAFAQDKVVNIYSARH